MEFDYPEHGINLLVRRFIEGMGDLSGRTVLDCPAGDGRASYLLQRQGATVVAADLFPLRFAVDGIECQTADLARELPFAGASFDFAICQEGIEHIQNQLTCLAEFNRVLKPGGTLLVTTPSFSHLRARLSNLLVESDLWKRQTPGELDAVWFVDEKPDEMYYGHLFLLTAQKLRAIAVLSGFEIVRFHPSETSTGSLLLMPFLYPFILLFSGLAYLHSVRRLGLSRDPRRLAIAREILRLNCRPQTLLQKDLVVELRKARDYQPNLEYLRDLHHG